MVSTRKQAAEQAAASPDAAAAITPPSDTATPSKAAATENVFLFMPNIIGLSSALPPPIPVPAC